MHAYNEGKDGVEPSHAQHVPLITFQTGEAGVRLGHERDADYFARKV